MLVTAINNWTKERQFRGLQSKIDSDHTFSVIRGGLSKDVNVDSLVVGDIVRIKYGKFRAQNDENEFQVTCCQPTGF